MPARPAPMRLSQSRNSTNGKPKMARQVLSYARHGSADMTSVTSSFLSPIDEIMNEARNGRMFILVDDAEAANEGHLVLPAQMATPDAINFMATHACGLICLSLTPARVAELGLSLMPKRGGDDEGDTFTVSIEAREGVTTGISAADRARTISVAIGSQHGAAELVTPGHVFPLATRDGGVLVRAAPAEASIDITRLAGLNPSAVLCGIMDEKGGMARLDQLITFAKAHNFKIGTIQDLISFRRRNDHLVECLAEATFDSNYGGQWITKIYTCKTDDSEHVVLQKGRIIKGQPTLVRMHATSLFTDLLGEKDKRTGQLQRAMEIIGENGRGVIVAIRHAAPKPLAHIVGLKGNSGGKDLRDYGIGAQILADLGVEDMILLTNSHYHIVGLEGYGLHVVGERQIEGRPFGMPPL